MDGGKQWASALMSKVLAGNQLGDVMMRAASTLTLKRKLNVSDVMPVTQKIALTSTKIMKRALCLHSPVTLSKLWRAAEVGAR